MIISTHQQGFRRTDTFNRLEAIAELRDSERYEELRLFLEATISAADEFRERRLEPSDN